MILHNASLRARYRELGQWSDVTLDAIFRRNVAQCPDRLAVADPPNRSSLCEGAPRRLSYRELDQRVDWMAVCLLEAGVGAGDIVVTQLPNILELTEVFLACARVGAMISPLPVQYGEHEIRQTFAVLEDVAAVVTVERFRQSPLAQKFRELAPGSALLLVDDPDISRVQAGDHAARVREFLASNPQSADDIVTICWTSGTVSAPKGVPRSHNNWLCYGKMLTESAGVEDGTVILNPFPAVNLSGIGVSIIAWLACAGSVHLHHPFDLEVFLQQIREERVGFTVAAPAVLTKLLQREAGTSGLDLGSLKSVMSGASALSPHMITEYRDRFGIDIINGFGSNEGVTLTSSVMDTPDPAQRAELFPRIGATGIKPTMPYHHWVETRLLEPGGEREISEPGVAGELCIRSGAVFPGYYRRPDLTAEAFDAEGYFRSGDLFEIALDATGAANCYRFVGRLKSLIIRGGMNISPEEVAGLIESHPAIAEVDVCGFADEVLGEKLCACVAFRSGESLDLSELVTYVSSLGVAKYKLPERLLPLVELPRNPVGKVDRRRLQQLVDEAPAS